MVRIQQPSGDLSEIGDADHTLRGRLRDTIGNSFVQYPTLGPWPICPYRQDKNPMHPLRRIEYLPNPLDQNPWTRPFYSVLYHNWIDPNGTDSRKVNSKYSLLEPQLTRTRCRWWRDRLENVPRPSLNWNRRSTRPIFQNFTLIEVWSMIVSMPQLLITQITRQYTTHGYVMKTTENLYYSRLTYYFSSDLRNNSRY